MIKIFEMKFGQKIEDVEKEVNKFLSDKVLLTTNVIEYKLQGTAHLYIIVSYTPNAGPR